jgi:bifunctional ADP-heptose synthase (sugar kinase/adenylyltransferase)
MIVSWQDLPDLAGKVVMVDGSFDPLHDGHIAYFAAAVEFGYPVFCNVTSDAWTVTKHPVLLAQQSRATVIDAIRHVSYVHCAESTTRDVLERVRPVIYVKGNDWLARGGVPEEEAGTCRRLGIEIAYVDTVLNSSTRLINQLRGT